MFPFSIRIVISGQRTPTTIENIVLLRATLKVFSSEGEREDALGGVCREREEQREQREWRNVSLTDDPREANSACLFDCPKLCSKLLKRVEKSGFGLRCTRSPKSGPPNHVGHRYCQLLLGPRPPRHGGQSEHSPCPVQYRHRPRNFSSREHQA